MLAYLKKNFHYVYIIYQYSKLLSILILVQKGINFLVLILIKLRIKKNYQNSVNIIDFDYFIRNEIGYFFLRKYTDDEYIVSSLFEDDLKKYFILDDGIFFDIGSHIGKYSIKIAKQNKNNFVYSFEANLDTYSSLQMNIIKNHLNNIKPINKGISDRKGKISFLQNKTDTGISRVISSNTKSMNGEIVEIDTISIDSFIKDENVNIKHIKLIKIDVEGHELNVLMGMKNLLLVNHTIRIICEITNHEKEILKYMNNLNYFGNQIKDGYILFEYKK